MHMHIIIAKLSHENITPQSSTKPPPASNGIFICHHFNTYHYTVQLLRTYYHIVVFLAYVHNHIRHTYSSMNKIASINRMPVLPVQPI